MMQAANATRLALLVLCTALAGCAQTALSGAPGNGVIAWDGAGRDPNLSPSAATAPSRHAAARQASESGAVDPDTELASNLVICRGCIARPQPQPSSNADVAARQ